MDGDLRALLLAGGYGTRLRPLTDRVPKCLVEIAGKPLLGHWLDLLFAGDCERVLVNTHHLAEAVRDFVGRSPWRHRIDLAHEPDLLGTAGTVLVNRDFFGQGTCLVAHADNFSDVDLGAFLHAHRRRPAGTVMTMLTFRTETPHTCGVVELDRNGVVQGFHEKVRSPPGNLANGAFYLIEADLIDDLTTRRPRAIDLSTEVLPMLVGRIATWEHTGIYIDIGTPESLARARAVIATGTVTPTAPDGDSCGDA